MPEDKTVFDINRPNRVGADPNSRPVIVGPNLITQDPMVRQTAQTIPKKIAINDHSLPSNIQPNFENLRTEPNHHHDLPSAHKSPVAILDGEALSSPAFGNDGSGSNTSPTKNSPFMPISASTGIAPDVPAGSLIDARAVNNGPSKTNGEVVPGRDNTLTMPKKKKSGRRRLWWLVAILVIAAGIYLALDSKILPNSLNLPVHIFNKSSDTSSSSSSSTTSPSSSLPDGFSKYNLAGTNLYFASPTAWGVPTVATDDGFTKRGGSNVADGKYAYMTSFPNNKDVQIIFTSSQYLPPARTALYYDFLQWCVGTNDGNYYQTAMRYTTANGVDTPATTSCDQGPLVGVTKLDNDMIVQKGAKTSDGKDFGDLYIKNLKDTNLVVAHVRDGTASNADAIKSILANIGFTSSSQ